MKVDLSRPLAKLLAELDACDEGRRWAAQHQTPAAAWEACENPAWMLWALNAVGLWDERKGSRFACWCARNTPTADGRTNWDLLTDARSRAAVEAAERFADGNATTEELSAAWSAAESAAESARSAAWSAAESARLAAWSAAWSAAESARLAAESARLAARLAARSAAESAWLAARSAQASAVRKFFGNPFTRNQ